MKANVWRTVVCISGLSVALAGCARTETDGLSSQIRSKTLMARDQPATQAAYSWDEKAAAAYLDQREEWWMEWQNAARDHQTFCVSCHTAMPYALARPALRQSMSEAKPSPAEEKLIDDVKKRVRLGEEAEPFYSDGEYGSKKAEESRGTEAVLNALILANYDSQTGRTSPETATAFARMWSLQIAKGDNRGAWPWLQFDLEPWESPDAVYYGATLAAVAVGSAPANYRSAPAVQDNLKLLREYLNRAYGSEPTINRVGLLWASTKLPGLVEPERQKAIVKEALDSQHADGGWNLPSIYGTWRAWKPALFLAKWKRGDGTPQESESDGYATGLVIFTLELAGVPRDNPQLRRGLTWLVSHQQPQGGFWPCYSLNKRRVPSSNVGKFMTDAATAYAVLALAEANVTPRK